MQIDDLLKNMPEKALNYSINISPNKDFIYFAIPKNGCSSVKVLLRHVFEHDIDRIKSKVHSRDESCLLMPSDIGYDEFIKLLDSPDVFKFTIIRDPYTRILSAYLDKFIVQPEYNIVGYERFLNRLLGPEAAAKFGYNKRLTFFEFLENVGKSTPRQMDEHWRPQVNQAMLHTINYSRIYRFEDMESSLTDVIANLRQLGSLNKELLIDQVSFKPHSTNATESLSKYYDKETLQIFNTIYREDLDTLSYRIR